MNIFLQIFLMSLHIFLAICLCFVILLQRPDGSISIASMKSRSSRSENVVLVNATIILSLLFFSLSTFANLYAEKQKKYNEINLTKNINDIY